MKTAIIAINITNGKRLLNTSGVPILLYWDGKEDVEQSLKTNEFKAYISKICFNCSSYASAQIHLISYYDDSNVENDEVHDIRTFSVQDLYSLKENSELPFKLLFEIVHELYSNIFKHNYNSTDIDDYTQALKLMLTDIRNEKNSMLSNLSILNYVRSKLESSLVLNGENYDIFIKQAKTIIL